MGGAGQGDQVDWARAALLGVWNPRLGPDTIAVHVEALKAAPPERKWTWWGRIYAGERTDEELLARWRWLAPLGARREFVLYVTSFDALHALRIDRVSTEPPTDRPAAYYAQAARVPLWFRVRDIRALHWTSRAVAESLADFAPVGDDGLVDRAMPFDPYAAKARYWPIVVEPLDRTRPDEFEDAPGYDCHLAEDVAYSSGVREAAAAFEEQDGPLWSRLPPTVQNALATARALRCERRLSGSDASASVTMIARAFEQLGVAFVHQARRAAEQRASLSELAQLYQENGWRDPATDPTFGQLQRAIGKLCSLIRTHYALELGLGGVCELLERYKEARNGAVHRGVIVAGLDVAVFEEEVWAKAAAPLLEATAKLARLSPP